MEDTFQIRSDSLSLVNNTCTHMHTPRIYATTSSLIKFDNCILQFNHPILQLLHPSLKGLLHEIFGIVFFIKLFLLVL